jgi:hypothetical protein
LPAASAAATGNKQMLAPIIATINVAIPFMPALLLIQPIAAGRIVLYMKLLPQSRKPFEYRLIQEPLGSQISRKNQLSALGFTQSCRDHPMM